MIDDTNQDEKHQEMLRKKTQTSKMWYQICELIQKNSLAAVAGWGARKAAGTAGHDKKMHFHRKEAR